MANNETYIGQHINMDGDEIRRLSLEKASSFVPAARAGEIIFNEIIGQIQYVHSVVGGVKKIKTLAPLKLGSTESILALAFNNDGETMLTLNLGVLLTQIIKDEVTASNSTWSSSKIDQRVVEVVNALGDSIISGIYAQVAQALGSYTTINNADPITNGVQANEFNTYLYINEANGQLTMYRAINTEPDPLNPPVWEWELAWQTPTPPTHIVDNTVVYGTTTSANLEAAYPGLGIGSTITNITDGIQFTKINTTQWKVTIIEII